MDPSQDPPPQSSTENTVKAVGRRAKSALSSRGHQQPSVRIIRGPSSTVQLRRPVPPDDAEKPLPQLPTHTHKRARGEFGPESAPSNGTGFANRFSDARGRVGALFGRGNNYNTENASHDEYDSDTVDLMDVMDPEVSTLSTLTNVQNSLFVPSLGKIVNRRATYRVSDEPGETRIIDKLKASLKRIKRLGEENAEEGSESKSEGLLGLSRKPKPPVVLSNAQYAILPDGEALPGWTNEEKEELDDIVRHKLHSRRARFKRSMKGFRQYVRRPLGLFITVYATLITLFGAAWVLFLIGWISLGSRQSYIINIVDNVLVALFAIIGDGLAPFRAFDTYHMIYIAHFHRKTWKRREKLGLPELVDHNDLPEQRKEEVEPAEVDLESLVARRMPRGLARKITPMIPKSLAQRMVTRNQTNEASYEYSVLSDEELAKLEYHERKFSKSHTFYKPHETETHFAFPLKLLVTVVLLLDLHSCLQISLGACTWGIPYKTRPFALTTVILCCSITCNIMGGVLISVGDKRTRKKDVIERMMRQELTSEGIEEMEKRWLKDAEERGEVDPAVRKRLQEEREEADNEEVKKSWKNVPLLPKVLLGKGEDHRQPSLPQKARRSSSNVQSTESVPTSKKSESRIGAPLPSVEEDRGQPSRPKPAVTRDGEPPKESTGQKVMRLIRRADLDNS